jgi:AAA-like domain/Bacterial regulatory proteins, luxR family
MDSHQFQACFESLTPRQRQVLKPFLLGRADEEIAIALHLEASTVRRHLANICKLFDLKNLTGEHYSYRDELGRLFVQHQPDWVNHALIGSAPPKTAQPIEVPGHPLAPQSKLYIPRPPIESRCQAELLKPGALIRIRAPQRMGKTSLLNRALTHAHTIGYKAIRLNVGQAESSILANLDTFLRWFCLNVTQRLGLTLVLEDYWEPQLGSLISCTAYMQQILQETSTNLVLGIDDVDGLLDFPETARGFFALLRGWYEEANGLEIWQNLRLIVVHATEVYIPLNLHQSPFNVGLPLRLPLLTFEQAQTLAEAYPLEIPQPKLATLYDWVGGHPYLFQLAFYALYSNELSLDDLLKTAATQAGIYSHHLRRFWQTLQARPALADALAQVLDQARVLDPILAYQLESMGLIQLQGNQACLSCELYRHYFRSLI